MHVFKTKEGAPAVELVGVGYLGPDGKGGLAVEEAAARGMSALLKKNADGSLVTDDEGRSVPLEGRKLLDAAKAWAELHGGVEVVNAKEEDVERFPLELGAAPDRPPAREVSIAHYERDYAGLDELHHNTPEEMTQGGVRAGVTLSATREDPTRAEQRVEEHAEEAAEAAAEARGEEG